jgi:hypothetical protein
MLYLESGTFIEKAAGLSPTYALAGKAEIGTYFGLKDAPNPDTFRLMTPESKLTVKSGKKLLIGTGVLDGADNANGAIITFKNGSTVDWTTSATKYPSGSGFSFALATSQSSDISFTWNGSEWVTPSP